MSLLTRKPEKLKGPVVPEAVEERIKRGRKAMMKDAPARRVAYKFWMGEHYWYVNEKNRLSFQDTVTHVGGSGKPPHRVRNKYNFVKMLVEAKVSAGTQRVPGYEVLSSTEDYADREAAIIASKIATYGYDKWGLRRATTKVVTNALVQREGFAMPYFDPDVGPFTEQINLETGEPEQVGKGEIKIRTFSRSEVMWEPGMDFDDSPWWAIQQAMPIDLVKRMPGYLGGDLVRDARTSEVATDRDPDEMCLFTQYLERPSKKEPNGRCLYIANGRQVCPKENYPSVDPDGRVTDDPVIHRLSYTVNPEGDDQGLVEALIDPQRTVNDCWNKSIEWKNRALNPQMKAPLGSFRKGLTQLDDTPGIIRFYNPISGKEPEWEQTPPIPQELRQMREDAILHMRILASDVDVQAEPDLAAKTASAAVEQSMQRWQSFMGDLAALHSRLMRHCLSLVQTFYTDERDLELQGDYAPETLKNFTGQDLRSQKNVRVSAGSLETQSRTAIRDEVGFIAATWPGAVTPEAGIAAMQDGVGSGILRSYKHHQARAARMVDLCRQGMEALSQIPDRFDKDVPATDPTGQPIYQLDPMGQPILDPMTGQPIPVLGMDVPGWMPRKQDNIDIWQQVFSDYMTTPSFEKLDPPTQHVFDLVWDGLDTIKAQRAQAEMMQRDMSAEGQGLDNAAKPQMAPPLPDRSQTNPK